MTRPIAPLVLITVALSGCPKQSGGATESAGVNAAAESPAPPSITCEPSAKFGPLAPVEILAGRFVACLPVGTTVVPNQRPIMGAAAPPDQTSNVRIPLSEGAEPSATLLFQDVAGLARGPWKERATEMLTEQLPGETLDVSLGTSIRGVARGPDPLGAGAGDGLGLVIRHPDETVHFIGFILDDGAEGLAREDAVALLSTLTDGGKARPIGGARSLPTGPGEETLEIVLPDDVIVTTDQGPDFLVHRLTTLAPLFEPRATAGLYFGGHPSFRHDEDVEQLEVTVYGQPASLEVSREEGWVAMEGLVALTGPLTLDLPVGDGLVMEAPRAGWFSHVMLGGPDEGSLDALRKAIADARWKSQPNE